MRKEPEFYLASEAPLGYDTYRDFVRPMMAFRMEKDGKSEDEIRYHLAVMDADEQLRTQMPVVLWIAKRLTFIPFVRKWLTYQDEYRSAFKWTTRFEAGKAFLDE